MKILCRLVLFILLSVTPLIAEPIGTLIFEDKFERNEFQEMKDEPGNGWTTSSDKTAAGQKQVDLRDGAMYMHTAAGANHAVSVRHEFAFEDGSVGVRFKLENEGDTLRLNFADLDLKSVHAGHLFDAVVGLDQVSFEDKKTGVMNLEIRRARQAESLTPKQKKSLIEKAASFPNPIEKGVWHDLYVHIDAEEISAEINGIKVGSFQSEGFAHPTKRLLRLLTPGHSAVDDVRIWRR